jgi:plastocyanin
MLTFSEGLMNKNKNNYNVLILASLTTAIILGASSLFITNAVQGISQQQPNIKAPNIYQTHTMVLGNNVKNLVIVIPNEAHEDPKQPKELRVVNQPYLPQNAVVNVGTTIDWFNADAAHHHSITLVNNNSKNAPFYESGLFNNFTASKSIKFNSTGNFAYYGPSFDKGVPSYKMNGTITVVNQPLVTSFNTTGSTAAGGRPNTIATIIVPGNLLTKISSDLKAQGFGIDNKYPFKSLRGGGSTAGGDKNQVMLVLTSSATNLNQVISSLHKVIPTLPYR